MPQGRESLIEVGGALRYWINRGAVNGEFKTTLDDGTPLIVVRGLTGAGYDVLENRPSAGGQTVVHATNVGVVGTMSGGAVNQTTGASFADLMSALEKVHHLAAAREDATAALVESAIEGVLTELQSAQPNENKITRVLKALSQLIQTLGEFEPAWTLVAVEAARLGIAIPLPPGLAH
jgi:hypothetical protein